MKASEYRGVRIRMRSPADGDAEVFFAAGGRPIHAGASQKFAVAGDGQFHDCEVDLSSVAGLPESKPSGLGQGWTGLVTGLRIDPVGKVGDVVDIDLVELIR